MTGMPGSDVTPLPQAVEQTQVGSPDSNRIECSDLCGSTPGLPLKSASPSEQ